MLGKCFTTELHPQPQVQFLFGWERGRRMSCSQGLGLGEDSYLQVRKGAVLLISKHTTVCCEILNA
jgi:hypothetical protein